MSDRELLEKLLLQEKTLQFGEFSHDTAFQIAEKIYRRAREELWAVTVDISRFGQQLVHFSMPGTARDNDEWIRRKCRVVERFSHSSYYMGVYYQSIGKTIESESFLDSREYIPFGGAFPIIIRNTGVIGTITVSGLSQERDHGAVIDALSEVLNIGQ